MAQVITNEIPLDSNSNTSNGNSNTLDGTNNTFDGNSNTSGNKRKRTSSGKHAIEIKYLENKNTRAVTFSKRRKGLFKKLRDLCIAEDAQAAIITISQAGKLYSDGSPSEDVVIRRYINSLNNNNNHNNNHNNSNIYNGDGNCWWDGPVDNLGLEEVERFKAALEGLRNDVITRIDKISRCSKSNAVQKYGINGNNEVISDFECKKIESIDTQEVIRPELLSADALLNLISIKGFI